MPRKGTNKKHNVKTKKKNKGAVITVDYEEYDYGDIEEGGDGKNAFVVRNSGDSPLVIDHIPDSADVRSENGKPNNQWKTKEYLDS